ncbi:MAG: phosphate signaling complex protein PhoU [Lachnospiraceae bacterium]
MRNRFDRQLEQLNNELINMGNLIEQAIEAAVDGLVTQNVEQAHRAMEYEDDIDRKEREIEALCMKLLLQQQPVASDLRLISSALKMITDMERIGDHATDISELTILLSKQPYEKSPVQMKEMAKETIVMVIQALDAFVRKDVELAKSVIARDDAVDALFLQVKSELIQLIYDRVETGEQAEDLLMAAKYFERIGDHAVNIAEWVIFSITGRHVDEEK